jgi:hypothetical protein
MSIRMKHLAYAALIGTMCALAPATSSAGTIYTYTAASGTQVVPSFSFTTSLTGTALDNLAPGTKINSTITAFTFEPGDVPTQDDAGFPIGGSYGSNYFNAATATVEIGTNAQGQITSWDISENVFASYPAFSGESPTDFYCRYNASSTNAGDTLSLTLDNDAGLCPGTRTTTAGTFSGGPVISTATPEPASAFLLGTGVLGLLGLAALRKRVVPSGVA